MLRQIQTSNNFISMPIYTGANGNFNNPDLVPRLADFQADSFTTGEKTHKNKFELFLAASIGVMGGAAACYSHQNLKLGKMLKLADEEVPFTIMGKLKKLADVLTKDAMTGLFNRRALNSSLSQGFKKAKSRNENFGVAMLDMDNFKAINEVFNHGIGDTVLKRIAANIKEVAKKHGAKGYRYGGEEFVVTMENHDAEAAKKVIQEIAEAIKKDKIIQDLVPEFKEKANKMLQCILPILSEFQLIFPQLRGEEKINDYRKLGNEIISLLEAHIVKYKPSERKIFNEIINNIKKAKDEELQEVLRINSKCSNGETLGNELDKIFLQYNGMKNDLQKWLGHINSHGMFTVSGGLVNLSDACGIVKDGKQMVRVADAALKTVKENGKNCIVSADQSLIQTTCL